ncbi:MAG TPA: hypothetical protein DIW47_02015 [Bacteroidetes bacterium]|nr:hypothetical protein [Bacteroidota bacterium]
MILIVLVFLVFVSIIGVALVGPKWFSKGITLEDEVKLEARTTTFIDSLNFKIAYAAINIFLIVPVTTGVILNRFHGGVEVNRLPNWLASWLKLGWIFPREYDSTFSKFVLAMFILTGILNLFFTMKIANRIKPQTFRLLLKSIAATFNIIFILYCILILAILTADWTMYL